MWIRCPNGVDTLVHHEDHINRLLSEGGIEIPDPTLSPVVEPIAMVFEPAVITPIEIVFDEPVIEPLQNYVKPVEVEDVTPRRRGRQNKS